MNGKGDKRRPVDANKFVDNYNNIFGEKKMNKDKIHEKLVMYWDTYQAMGKNRPDEEHELRDRFFHYLVGMSVLKETDRTVFEGIFAEVLKIGN